MSSQAEFDAKLDKLTRFQPYKLSDEQPYDAGPEDVLLAPPDSSFHKDEIPPLTLRQSTKATDDTLTDDEDEKDEVGASSPKSLIDGIHLKTIATIAAIVVVGYSIRGKKMSDSDITTAVSIVGFVGIIYLVNKHLQSSATGSSAGEGREEPAREGP